MNKLTPNWKVFCSDIDDTLAMGNLSDYPNDIKVGIPYGDNVMTVVPNYRNINTLIKFKKLGYHVILWSRTGGDWAQAVAEAFGLENFVDQYLTKPIFLLDDRPVEEWTERLWRK